VSIADDGDIVRGLGFVTMYAAWVEEAVDDLLRILGPIKPFDDATQRWSISKKLKHAAELIRTLNCVELKGFPEDLEGAVELFYQRNKFVHGRIYVGHDRTDYIKGGRPDAPTNAITSAELYAMANEFWEYRNHFNGLRLFSLPRAVENYRNGTNIG
jgi:hypothetical protein